MYIYPITDPEILELGIRMALYREKKPTGFSINPDPEDIGELQTDISEWEMTDFIAYLKEPEFKVGNYVYLLNGENEFRYRIYKVIDESFVELECIEAEEIKTILISKISHYCLGQEVESFKYVKKELKKEVEEDTETSFVIKYTEKWQEVEEPEETTTIKELSQETFTQLVGSKIPNPKYTQFQKEIEQAKILAKL